MNIRWSNYWLYNISFIEDDRIQKDDPEEEEALKALSKRNDLYEILSESVGI